mgnify:CR=1 FL=1
MFTFLILDAVKFNKLKIENAVRAFVHDELEGKANVHEAMNASYIIDVILIPNDSQLHGFEVKLVELNPFGEYAGSCMFEWFKEKDFKILTGEAPFEFRVVEKVPKFAIKTMAEEWQQFCYPEKLIHASQQVQQQESK